MQKFKKLLLIIFSVILLLLIFSPYLLTFYVQQRYYKLTKLIENLTPGIKVNNYLRQGYLKSLLISKIQISNDAWISNPLPAVENNNLINYVPHTIITLEHLINISPFNSSIISINTKVLTGLPKFIKEHNKFKMISKMDIKGRLETKIDEASIQYFLSTNGENITASKASLNLTDDCNNIQLDLIFPSIIYQENVNKVEVENLHINLKAKDYTNPDKFRIKLLTELNKFYLINKQKVLFKLSNLNMEQKLSDHLSNKISFLKLNVFNNKFGPLATKVQANNINLARIIENLPDIKFPLNQEQLSDHRFIQFANSLLKYKPSVSADILLYLGKSQMNVLTDFIIDSQAADWMNMEDILDSLSINLFAKIPKEVTLDLLTQILAFQTNPRGNYPNNLFNKLNSSNSSENKNAKQSAEEKLKYLLKNNIIQEEDNNIVINLSIAEGTFYSRMNPFKIFSF